MPPIIKYWGRYVMAYASVSVNIWFPSIIGQMPGSIDPLFLWLIGGDWRKVPFDDQLSRSGHLGFGFRRLQDKHLGRLISFLCGSLGMTRGRFHSSKMAATAAIFDLVSVD
jgi:hypothetical protein